MIACNQNFPKKVHLCWHIRRFLMLSLWPWALFVSSLLTNMQFKFIMSSLCIWLAEHYVTKKFLFFHYWILTIKKNYDIIRFFPYFSFIIFVWGMLLLAHQYHYVHASEILVCWKSEIRCKPNFLYIYIYYIFFPAESDFSISFA